MAIELQISRFARNDKIQDHFMIEQPERGFNLKRWAYEIVHANEFDIDSSQKVYTGHYYTEDHERNVIFFGIYKGRPAVLKVYNDPRETHEVKMLQGFHEAIQGQDLHITAPQYLAGKEISDHRGWVIMERLPETAETFERPLSRENRRAFLKLYETYYKEFPKDAFGPAAKADVPPAHEFHKARIERWYGLGKESLDEILGEEEAAALKARVFDVIDEVFADRQMWFCHGHFKPSEVYIDGDQAYLIDFAHAKHYPEGYELAFIVWADCMMVDTYWDHPDPDRWQTRVEEYVERVTVLLEGLHPKEPTRRIRKGRQIHKPVELMRGAMLERAVGTLFADVCASDLDIAEKKKRAEKLVRYIETLTHPKPLSLRPGSGQA